MNIGKKFLILVAAALACLFFTGCSRSGEEVGHEQKEAEEDPRPAPPLDSPTAFMLYIADRSELDGAGYLCDLIEALVQSGDKASARKICQKALKATDQVKEWNEVTAGGHRLYFVPLGRIGAVLARTGDSKQALNIANKISAYDKRSLDMRRDKWDALCRIADGFTQAGDTSQASKICLQALKSAENIETPLEYADKASTLAGR